MGPVPGGMLISFTDLPGRLTLPDETGGVISNYLGPYHSLSFHGEPAW